MRVHGRKGVLDPRLGASDPVQNGAGEGAVSGPGADRVSVSEAARELAVLRVGVGDLRAVDGEKVARLSASVARGEYSADFREVARRVLRELLGDVLA
jgi:anti-sigma28 factor (negative regulator of flagellin synthesis)